MSLANTARPSDQTHRQARLVLVVLLLLSAVRLLLALAVGAVVFNARKIRGESFALITMAVGFVLATVIVNTPIDGGPGVYLSAVPIPAIGPSPSATFYLLALALVLLVLWVLLVLFSVLLVVC